MTSNRRYQLVGSSKFVADLRQLRSQAIADPVRHGHLYRDVLREIERLRYGISDGHHTLGYEAGKGDLRDCVTSRVHSDGKAPPDHRLVFREIGPTGPGQSPRRELLAVKPRHGSGNIYEHTCARLGRHPNDRQPGLDRFGRQPASSGGSQAERQAALDTKRAIAHAWAGQQPLATSRTLNLAQFGQRGATAPTKTPTPEVTKDR